MSQEIITGIKKDEGIHIIWQKGKDTRSTFFYYQELIDQQINALDLIANPGRYVVDETGHTITMKGKQQAG